MDFIMDFILHIDHYLVEMVQQAGFKGAQQGCLPEKSGPKKKSRPTCQN